MQHFLEFITRKLAIARPIEALQNVLWARRHRKNDVHDGLVAGTFVALGSGLFNHFWFWLAESSFQVSPRVKSGKQLPLDQLAEPSAGVLQIGQPVGSSLKRREFGLTCTGELDVANSDQNIGDVILDSFYGPVTLGNAQIVNVTWDRTLHQHRLQYIRDLVGHVARKRQFALK